MTAQFLWTTADGQTLEPKQMEWSHIVNCIRLLKRRIEDAESNYPWDYGDSDGTWGAAQSGATAVSVYISQQEEWIEEFRTELTRRAPNSLPASV